MKNAGLILLSKSPYQTCSEAKASFQTSNENALHPWCPGLHRTRKSLVTNGGAVFFDARKFFPLPTFPLPGTSLSRKGVQCCQSFKHLQSCVPESSLNVKRFAGKHVGMWPSFLVTQKYHSSHRNSQPTPPENKQKTGFRCNR